GRQDFNHDLRRSQTDGAGDRVAHAGRNRPGIDGFGRLDEHDDLVVRSGTEKGDGASCAHAVDASGDPFEVLGVVVVAVRHDDVLQSTGDEELVAGQIAEIAGAQPPVHERIGDVVSDIPLHHARTAYAYFSDES